ncbi:MAG: aminoacyl-tRNA hydrolase [Patescibacteria group bacterium]
METAGKGKLENISLIAGLGNPDAEYENTYHNVGMRAIDFLLERCRPDALTKKVKLVRGFFEYIGIHQTIFIKPIVFMNESGKAIAKALRFFNVKPENMVIIHDDSDLYVGDFKVSFGSGSAGHKGVESLISQLGTKNFFRVRIGIRTPEENRKRRKRASELVLENITPEHQKQFIKIFENMKDWLERKKLLI